MSARLVFAVDNGPTGYVGTWCKADAHAKCPGGWPRTRFTAHAPESGTPCACGCHDDHTDHVGVPFVQDGIRDGEHLRPWMTGRFVGALEATGRPWQVLKGSRAERTALALAAVDDLCGRAWRYPAPVAHA